VLFAFLAAVIAAAPKERDGIAHASITLAKELRTLLVHPLALAIVLLFFAGAAALADKAIHWSDNNPWLWPAGSGIAALLLLVSLFRHLNAPENFSRTTLTEGPMFGALFEMLQRPGIVPVVLFILLFKLGDAAMGFMVKPFWVDAGFSATQIGLVSVQISLALSIAGGIAGGWFTDRFGIFRALWILGLLQALSNLGYAGVATLLPVGEPHLAPSGTQQALLYFASGVESFTGGLGTGAFLAFLMAIVDKRRSAAEYALLSSLFALSRSVAGVASGFGVEAMGYANYFLLTFFLSFPAYLLLPWVLRMLNRHSSSHEAAT
jgi:PAT family beta-lactamase induction signal transducer AmpG